MNHTDCDVCRFIDELKCNKCGVGVHPDDVNWFSDGHVLCGFCIKDFYEWQRFQH